MRTQTREEIKSESVNRSKGVPHVDIIKQTRKLVTGMDQKQRFWIAKEHLQNALAYKAPRLDIFMPDTSDFLKICYNIQTSLIWRAFLLLLAYVFMYAVIWEQQPASLHLIVGESIILLVMWADVFMEIYHKSQEVLELASKFQLRFYVRVVVLLVLIVDFVLVITLPTMPIRPTLIMRCFLPLFYDSNVRKMFQALILAYKDILVLLFFYATVVVFFAIIANQIIQLPREAEVDQFSSNYRQLDKTIFIMYALSTYDAYPDNQLVAIRAHNWNYVFFIAFIILNIFFFATIPPTLVFNSFRETRSKIVLVDEIKQQHSLLMSFVSLGEDNLNISIDKLIRFLIYVYKNKVRYVDHITDICRSLDQNNNKTIHIKEYMHLCEILQAKTAMLPPKFNDIQAWLKFRKFVNETLRLRQIISSKKFKIISSLIILVTFINGCLSLYTRFLVFSVIDDVLILLFVVEIFIKIAGLGIESFFADPWNKLDFLLVMVSLILEVLPQQYTPHNSDVLLKMARVFRIAILLKSIPSHKKFNDGIYMKVSRLISQIAIIIPILLRFLPIYMIALYLLGTTAMQIFKQNNKINTEKSPYDAYQQYSNFTQFIYSQLLFLQVMVQSNWSTVAYDYAFKYGYFGWVMLFFVLGHALLVTVLTSLIKGVTWEVYSSVHEEFNDRMNKIARNKRREQKLQRKKDRVEEIKARLNERQFVMPNNLIARELCDNKIDEQILKKLRINYENNKINIERKRRRSEMLKFLMPQHNILTDDLEDLDIRSSRSTRSEMVFHKGSQFVELDDIEGDDDLREEDIEEEMEKILNRFTLHNAITYTEAVVYPKTLTEFLEFKIKIFNAHFMDNELDDPESQNHQATDFFITGINNLLGIEISERQQKSMILNYMANQGIITQEQSARALKKYFDVDHSFDENWIMRKAFLSDTNQKLIKKFEIEYFSNLYGKSFKQINRVTIEPLLRLESKLTYSLRNIVKYRKISQQKFFTILTTIQDMMSNQLLKKGSLFKFVYQINCMADIWFSVQQKQSNQLRLNFIKNGIWAYHKGMKSDEIMVGEDVFHCDNMPNVKNEAILQMYIKMLYSSFESLAFCLNSEKNFFLTKPGDYVYNLFTYFKDVDQVNRIKEEELKISKIMLVMLCKQDERQQPLRYELSSIQKDEQKKELTIPFRIGESQNETYIKLKRMQLLDHERVIQNEGMPFNNIANLMMDIQSIIREHEVNFVMQVEGLLNRQMRNTGS